MKNYKKELLDLNHEITEISIISQNRPLSNFPLMEKLHIKVKGFEEWSHMSYPIEAFLREGQLNLMYEKIYNNIYGKQENVIT